jgi:hypothetical protein
MDKTRRTVLTATATAGLGVIAYSLRQRGDAPASADGIRIVPGLEIASAPAAASMSDPGVAPWQRLIGQRLVLSSGGTGFAVTVAAVTALAPTVMGAVASAPARNGFLGAFEARNGGRALPRKVAALPAGVRAQGFSVLFDVHSGEAPVTDMLMDLDRAVAGLSRVFVQPATAVAGVPRVIAYFN